MLRSILAAGVSLLALAGAAAADPVKFDAVLTAHAELPAASFTPAPADAPVFPALRPLHQRYARRAALRLP